MKNLRRLLLLILVAVTVVVAGLAESFNILAARHRDQVRQELQKILGQDVSFASLEVHLLGRPGFVAKDFRIADDTRFAATPMLRASELVLGVSLWNLLSRRLVITSFTLNDPEFQVITDESGHLNLTALIHRKSALRKFPRLQPALSQHKALPVSFAVDKILIQRGRVDYLDRSVKEPAELRIRNVSLSVQGFEPGKSTRLRLRAALTEGLSQDFQIDGDLAPPPEKGVWLQRGIDLTLRFDSLRIAVVARAIAALRDKIPGELDVTGPMALQARAGGTLERPLLDNITLKIPLFGSSDYNATINGSVHFTEQRTWEDAQLEGRLVLEPLSLARLRNLKLAARLFSPAVVTDGTASIFTRFEGTWETLRIGALVRADKSELDYSGWFRKAADSPATIRARISREKRRLVFHESELLLGPNRLNFSGKLDFTSTPELSLKLRSQRASVAAWSPYFTIPDLTGAAGKFDLDVTVARSLLASGAEWRMAGRLKLDGAEVKPAGWDRRVENLHALVAFTGRGARFQATRFRVGRSDFLLDGNMADLFAPRMLFSLQSPEVDLADLPMVGDSAPLRLKNISGVGEIFRDQGRWRLTGAITSPRGEFGYLAYQDLRGDIEMSDSALSVKNVWARTLNGGLRAEAIWTAFTDHARELQISTQLEAVELRALMAQLLPPLSDRLDGQLSGAGSFQATGAEDNATKSDVKGSGDALIRDGVIKNFNLVSQLLLRGSGASGSRLPPGFAALVSRPDTNFDTLKAKFTVDQKRIGTDDLVITTPDYTVTGAGWIGFDRSTNWNVAIVLSPRLTQEVQRDYRIIRYLLDRRGRLSISFRVEGKIPNVSIRLENRALAQALRAGAGPKGSATDGAGGESGKPGKRWLPDALERFLNR